MAGTITAVYRPTDRVIRVWQGFGLAEDLTLAEARVICRAGDDALLFGTMPGFAPQLIAIDLPDSDDLDRACSTLVLRRDWLVSLLAALRRALRAVDAAQVMGRGDAPAVAGGGGQPLTTLTIDDAAHGGSDAGSWARHLRHVGAGSEPVGANP